MADPTVAPVANVPWAPVDAASSHQDAPVADDTDDVDDRDLDEPADFENWPSRAPSRLRRSIPLLWAAALTVAALQHAGEVERRMALLEPSSAEMEMQNRSKQEIRAAWRSLGAVTVTEETKPVEPVAVEQKAEPVMVKRQIEPVAVRDVEIKTLEVERPLVEPVTQAIHKTMASDEAAKAAAEPPAWDDIDTNAATIRTSEAQTTSNASRTLPPVAEQAEPEKPDRKGRVITSHAPQQKTARVAKPKRARPAQAKSIKYVELDGYSPRYFTIERPSRASP